ncbi:MAG: 2-C-methyl-D-erythritol 4-phosphate cytidylyltransferase [Gammaproteobacteria bacterium]|nr:MAG: 2-C-methyl-D-erythritol 4-phosphate cytidylyltransferase [Gammaproteobacteria bacterium]
MKYWAVIPAAGVGARMGADRPKQYLELLGRTVIEHTLSRFLDHPAIAGVFVALGPQDGYWPQLPVAADARITRVEGGRERCHSVLNALRAILAGPGQEEDRVLVHDAARPCLRREDLDRLIEEAGATPEGGILAVPVRDTMKRAGAADAIDHTIDRNALWHALTPQLFPLGALHEALQSALDAGHEVTDEASAMEHAGYRPRLVRGHADNIKITLPEDLALARFYLEQSA